MKTNNSTSGHKYSTDLLASSSRNFAFISLLGGYFGKLDGSQASGSVLKYCQRDGIHSNKSRLTRTPKFLVWNKLRSSKKNSYKIGRKFEN